MSEPIEKVRCLIIGSGPAGYTAGIYTARADLKPVLYEGIQPGGQLTITTEIENFPGYPQGVTGHQMMKDLREQCTRFGADIRPGIIEKLDLSSRPFLVTAENGKQISAETIIIATGASARWLGLESEEHYLGNGVSACATCDGFFYKGQDVAVVGGGDTACEEASYLSNICNKVYLIVRRDELRASKVMQRRVKTNPKIEILWNRNPVEILGDLSGVNSVVLYNNKTEEKHAINVTGFFIAIGHYPNTRIVEGQLRLDEDRYIVTQKGSTQTSVEGVFAAGDVQDPRYRQAVIAAGSGAVAAIEAERFLSESNH